MLDDSMNSFWQTISFTNNIITDESSFKWMLTAAQKDAAEWRLITLDQISASQQLSGWLYKCHMCGISVTRVKDFNEDNK